MYQNLLVSSDPMPNEIQEQISKKKIKECVGKLELKNSLATCFFIKLPIFNNNHKMKVLLTNNHVINDDYLKNSKTLTVEINEKKKTIDLFIKRFIYTNDDLFDFTIIEIKECDFIDQFLEVDEGIFSQTYVNNDIYIPQFPQKNQYDSLNYKGLDSTKYKGKLSSSWGKIIKNDEKYLYHNCNSYEGSSGSPLILIENHKVIGLHKGKGGVKNSNAKNEVGLGISIKNVIDITRKKKKNIVEEKDYKEYFYIISKAIIYNILLVLILLLLILILIICQYLFSKKKLYYPNGNLSYYGYILFNKKHWKGISYYKSKNIEYDGQWKNDLKDGLGILYEDDENNTKVYNGTFQKGLISGKGIEYYKNGNILYNGSWLQSLFHGYGEYYYPNNQLRYKGFFSNGRRDGDGILYNEDGSYNFIGDWKLDNMFIGELFYDNNNKTKYIGHFNKDNRYQWGGEYFYNNEKNTRSYKGYYENENKYYEGSLKDGYFHGKGLQYYDNGQLMYNGTYENGDKSGKGIFYIKNSTIRYVGEFKNDKFEGNGILYDNDKIIYNGTFKDNHYEYGILNINGTKVKIYGI